jgi:hypothetical protein
MKLTKTFLALALGTALAGLGYRAFAQHSHSAPGGGTGQEEAASHEGHAALPDPRVLVAFPDQLRVHTMANMRDHLRALAEIQDALGRGAFDEAGKIAEDRLGMSSLTAHGAHEIAKYMPQGMQDAGTAMHHGASQFAIELQKTAVTGDLKPALAALARTTQACVACHAGYRLQ